MSELIVHFVRRLLLAASIVCCVAGKAGAGPPVTHPDQGWSDADRDSFYTTNQGSAIMPYQWFKALRRLDVDEMFAVLGRSDLFLPALAANRVAEFAGQEARP